MMPRHDPTRFVWHDELPSTNTHAMQLAAAGEVGPVWIAARRQTAGRGRSGRAWQSPTGNLAASFLFRPGCPPEHLAQLAFVAGLAAFDAILALVPPTTGKTASPLQLKWPNDVLIGRAKIAGLLVEATQAPGSAATTAVMGFGINLAAAPDVDGRETAALSDLFDPIASSPNPDTALAELDRALALWLRVWATGAGFADIRVAWLKRSIPIGTEITVHAVKGPICGTFAGLGDDGALLLREPTGNVVRLTHGDVALGPAKSGPLPQKK